MSENTSDDTRYWTWRRFLEFGICFVVLSGILFGLPMLVGSKKSDQIDAPAAVQSATPATPGSASSSAVMSRDPGEEIKSLRKDVERLRQELKKQSRNFDQKLILNHQLASAEIKSVESMVKSNKTHARLWIRILKAMDKLPATKKAKKAVPWTHHRCYFDAPSRPNGIWKCRCGKAWDGRTPIDPLRGKK